MAIYLDRDGVEAVVKKIDEAIGNLRDAAAMIDGEFMGNLGSFWQGSAYDKTMTTYETDYQTMLTKDVPEMVDSLSSFITNCKNAIVEVDAQLSGG